MNDNYLLASFLFTVEEKEKKIIINYPLDARLEHF